MTTREFVSRYPTRTGRKVKPSGLCILRTDIGKFAQSDAQGNPVQVTFGSNFDRASLQAHVDRWASSTNFKMKIVKIEDVLDVEAAGTN